MSKPTNRSGGLSLSFTQKENLEICIQEDIFSDYLVTEHGFGQEAAEKVAADFHAVKLTLKNNGGRTRIQCIGDRVFRVLRVPAIQLTTATV